jgi:hypothetical protein
MAASRGHAACKAHQRPGKAGSAVAPLRPHDFMCCEEHAAPWRTEMTTDFEALRARGEA